MPPIGGRCRASCARSHPFAACRLHTELVDDGGKTHPGTCGEASLRAQHDGSAPVSVPGSESLSGLIADEDVAAV